MEYKTVHVQSKKRIALVAHDHKKEELLAWVKEHVEELRPHFLVGTGTTAAMLEQHTGLPVKGLISGPLGGDQQLGACISESQIDLLIFFWDPLEAQPHDPDVKALLRIATLYNVPVASCRTTAQYLLSSPLFQGEYDVEVLDNTSSVRSRLNTFGVGKKLLTLLLCLFFLCGCGNKKTLSQDSAPLKEEVISYTPSSVDFNNNGKDDYYDLYLGAKKDADNKPVYDGSYVVGGYPDENKGVCTDLVWRAFRQAGYDLKAMVDADIKKHPKAYSITKPDPNIDFRRVPNLDVFFRRYATSLTTDIHDYEEFSLGDIVVYRNQPQHIGIVSPKTNSKGRHFLLHNAGGSQRENDRLDFGEISSHYRFDASKIPKEVLIPWQDER